MKNRLVLLPLIVLTLGFGIASCKQKDMSMKMNEPRNIRGVISYKRAFNDLNDTHLNIAQAIGVAPIEDREAAEHMTKKLKLIKSNPLYAVDSLTHSIPTSFPGLPNCWIV